VWNCTINTSKDVLEKLETDDRAHASNSAGYLHNFCSAVKVLRILKRRDWSCWHPHKQLRSEHFVVGVVHSLLLRREVKSWRAEHVRRIGFHFAIRIAKQMLLEQLQILFRFVRSTCLVDIQCFAVFFRNWVYCNHNVTRYVSTFWHTMVCLVLNLVRCTYTRVNHNRHRCFAEKVETHWWNRCDQKLHARRSEETEISTEVKISVFYP